MCFPIRVPKDDAFWGPRNKTCLSFARSFAAPGLDCELEFRQQVLIFPLGNSVTSFVHSLHVQMNQITHWLDGSNMYGSNAYMLSKLRGFEGGRLKTGKALPGGSAHDALPTCGARNAKDKRLAMCSGSVTKYTHGGGPASVNIFNFLTNRWPCVLSNKLL